ncbi:MAG: carboxypeptidase M32 [Vampirovibrionales bacterium]
MQSLQTAVSYISVNPSSVHGGTDPQLQENRHTLETIKDHLKALQGLTHAMALMGWDTETHMPEQGTARRGEAYGVLAGLHHERLTDAVLASKVEKLGTQLSFNSQEKPAIQGLTYPEAMAIKTLYRSIQKAKKVPTQLISQLSEATSKAQPAWVEARKTNQFKVFQPHLETIVKLTQDYADCLGWEQHRYDALLDEYEEGLTVATLDPLFQELQTGLTHLLQKIGTGLSRDRFPWLQTSVPGAVQKQLSQHLANHLGFDLHAGRIDEAAHPFCSGSHAQDVRLTNRYFPHDWTSSLFSLLHETGHGLYEQGIREALYPLGLAEGASMAIHESQSRLWENLVGRSLPFWSHMFGTVKQVLQTQLGHNPLETVDVLSFHQAMNCVSPSLIRVEADEVTYNLHVIVRYELEKQLIAGTLEVADIPEAWNHLYETYLGIIPKTDTEGCLQDVHWSHGSFGYFPTYTLGNLYSAMILKQVEKEIPTLWNHIASGECHVLRDWLKEHIHQYGKLFTPKELILEVTGKPLSMAPFLSYLEEKYLAFLP